MLTGAHRWVVYFALSVLKSTPCYAVSLYGCIHRLDGTTSSVSARWSLPAAKLPLGPHWVSEQCPCTGRCHRRCSCCEPSEALLQWEGCSSNPMLSWAAPSIAGFQSRWDPQAGSAGSIPMQTLRCWGPPPSQQPSGSLEMEPLRPKINYSYRQCIPIQCKGSQGRIWLSAEQGSACCCLCGGERAAGFPRARCGKHSTPGTSPGRRSEPPRPPVPQSKPQEQALPLPALSAC